MSLSSFKLPSLKRRRLFWRRHRSATITDLDPSFKVVYLGNVLTGWAKGEGCTEKPLQTLWRNHVQSSKTHIPMKLSITAQGLKAFTKEHGLTEYWANKITYCRAEANYPKLFCWIYRHEGRKLKQELRCHAVLCSSQSKASTLASTLTSRLQQALFDFRLEKLSRQNARLNVANAIYEQPSMPIRKLMLHTGTSNYVRARSPPKLKAIEECSLEEEQEEMHQLHLHVLDPEDINVNMVEEDPQPSLSVRLNPLRRSSSNPLELRARLGSHSKRAKDDNEISLHKDDDEHDVDVDDDEDEDDVDEDDEDDDEDVIKDYISTSLVASSDEVADVATVVQPPTTLLPHSSPSCAKPEMELIGVSDVRLGVQKLKLFDQDTISDESGYCEESASRPPSHRLTKAVFVIQEQDTNPDDDNQDDLTVHSAMIMARKEETSSPKSLRPVEDFCIHI